MSTLRETLDSLEESLSRLEEQCRLQEALTYSQLGKVLSDPMRWINDMSKLGSAEIKDPDGNLVTFASGAELLYVLLKAGVLSDNVKQRIKNLGNNREALEKVANIEGISTVLDYFLKGKVTSNKLNTIANKNPNLGRVDVFAKAAPQYS